MKTELRLIGIIALMFTNSHTTVADALPTAESLFTRHMTESYGKNQLGKPQSMTIHQNVSVEQFGIDWDSVVKRKTPNLMIGKGNVMGQETMNGCQPPICWEKGFGRDLELIEGPALSRWIAQSDFYQFENIGKQAKSMETQGIVDIEGTTTYKVSIIDEFNKENLYYFDKDSGLLRVTERQVADGGHFEFRTNIYSDYKRFGEFTMATKIVEDQPMSSAVITINEVSFEDIPDSDFDPPELIKNMIAIK